MGIIGVRCVLGDVSMPDHVKCMREHGTPPCGFEPTILNMITRPKLERIAQGVVFSPSSIQGCHRQHSLQADHSWYIDIEKTWNMIRGDLFHAGLAAEPAPPESLGAVRELRMHAPIQTENGIQKFSGQIDLIVFNRIDTEEDGSKTLHVKLVDYKSKNNIEHSLIEADRRHVYQINEYAFLATTMLIEYMLDWEPGSTPYGVANYYSNGNEHEHIDFLSLSRVVVDELAVVYLSSNKVRTFTTSGFMWARGKMKGAQGDDGHWHAFVPHEYEELELAPMKFFNLDYTEEIIKKGIEAQMAGSETLAPPLEGDDAKLMCGSCPVRQVCYNIGLAQGFDMKDQKPYVTDK